MISDYYAFGMIMPGRKFNAGDYRFGFNGQEKDDEISGVGNSYTAEFWQYDPRLGRRWNLDPEPQIFISDYVCFANNPVFRIDPLGNKVTDFGVKKDGSVKQIGPTDNKPDKLFALNEDGTKKSNVDPVTINDKTILPQLTEAKPEGVQKDYCSLYGEKLQGHYSISSDGKEAAKVFEFAADNSNVEWTFQGNKGSKYIIGTLHENAQAFDVYGFEGFERNTVGFHIHSHPNATKDDFSISSNDRSNAISTWKVNPQAKYYVYAPKLTKLTWNKVYPNRKINNEPGKLMKIEK